MPYTKINPSHSHGMQNCLNSPMCKSNKISSEIISKYFTKNQSQSGTKIDKDTSINDFETPVKHSKVSKLSQNKAKISRKCKKPPKKHSDLQQKLMENFRFIDTNYNHLQMAIVISKSLATEEKPLTKTLDEFGFISNKPKIEPLNRKPLQKYILLKRTNEERQSLIESKISLILKQNTRYQKEIFIENETLFSEFLLNFICTKKSLFNLNNTSFTQLSQEHFYLNNLNITFSKSICGCLLKNWKTIPGREQTPTKQGTPKTEDKVSKFSEETREIISKASTLCPKEDTNNSVRCPSPDLFDSDEENLHNSGIVNYEEFSKNSTILNKYDFPISISDESCDLNLEDSSKNNENNESPTELDNYNISYDLQDKSHLSISSSEDEFVENSSEIEANFSDNTSVESENLCSDIQIDNSHFLSADEMLESLRQKYATKSPPSVTLLENVESENSNDPATIRNISLTIPDTNGSEVSGPNNFHTPNRLIIKTTNITPMANYDKMCTPEVHNKLEQCGLKPLKRQCGVKLLKYIYDSTHPLIDSAEETPTKKRKCEIFADLLTVDSSDLIFERKQSSKVHSCRIPLDIVWCNFLSCNEAIRKNILLYEPLQLEVLHSMIKEQGYQFHIQDLLNFLDKKCVTVRSSQDQKCRNNLFK